MRLPEPAGGAARTSPSTEAPAQVQRVCAECEEELQRAPTEGAAHEAQPASPEVAAQVHSLRGSGQPLPPETRAFFEPRFGHDFGRVRVHTDARATRTARSLHARAFTLGSDIAFAPGQYTPGTVAGRRLLAHELTHVLQQTGGDRQLRGVQRSVIQRDTGGAQPLEQDKPEESTLTDILDEIMPVGRGYHLETDLGITPVIPIYISEGRLIEVRRLDAQRLHILYRQQGIVAGDTGVGAHAFIGNTKRQQGLGLAAGAHAQAGIKVVTHQEFIVPLSSLGGFLAEIAKDQALKAVVSGGSGASSVTLVNALDLGLRSVRGPLLEGFETRRLINFGEFAQGTAEASAGLRERNPAREGKKSASLGDNFIDAAVMRRGGERVPPSKTADNQWSPIGVLQTLLTLRAAIQGRVEAGVNLDNKRTIKPGGGEEHEISFAVEGAAGVDLQLPIFGMLPIPTSMGGGVSLKLKITTDASGNVIAHSDEWTLYRKSGELDVYAGPASQETFRLNALNLKSLSDMLSLLTPGAGGKAPTLGGLARAMLQKVEVQQRYNLAMDMGRKFSAFMRNRVGSRELITDTANWKKATKGASIGAYLTVSYGMDSPDLLKVWELIKPEAAKAYEKAQEAEGLVGAYQALKQFTAEFLDSPQFAQLEGLFLDSAYVTEASVRFTAEAGLGAQVQIAEGAKARLDGFVEAGLFCEQSLASGKISVRNFMSVVSDVMADPRKYIPNCPLLRWMYDNLAGKNEPGLLLYQLPDEESGKGLIKGKEPGEGKGLGSRGEGPGRGPRGAQGGGGAVEVRPVEEAVSPTGKETFNFSQFRQVSEQLIEGQLVHRRDGSTFVVWVPLRVVKDHGDKVEVALNATLPLRITPKEATAVYLYPNSPPITVPKSLIKKAPKAP
ncbi:MAG: DUF4157 domain-containing protein [Myxococcaceae bacterium]|nr:DUF4157 domain-containing protein [Myxococcaceae bacterium]